MVVCAHKADARTLVGNNYEYNAGIAVFCA